MKKGYGVVRRWGGGWGRGSKCGGWGGKGLIINKSDSFFFGGRVFQGVGHFMECRRLTTMGSMYHYGTLMVTTIKSKSYQTNCSRVQDLMKKCRAGASL